MKKKTPPPKEALVPHCFICETSGDEGQPQYAIITLTIDYVTKLLARYRWFTQFQKTDTDLELMEYGDDHVEFYDQEPDIGGHASLDLHSYDLDTDTMTLIDKSFIPLAPNYVVKPDPEVRLAYTRVVINAAHVYWIAALKNAGGEFETRTISHKDLTAWLKSQL